MAIEGSYTLRDKSKTVGQRYDEFMSEVEFQRELVREKSRQLDKKIEGFVNELDRLGMIR